MMETDPYLWPDSEGIEEIKQSLLCTELELITARREADEEIKKYQVTIKHLLKLLNQARQERDEARDQLQLLHINMALPKQPSEDVANHSASSLMIDKLAWGKPLPQKGTLLRAVTEAGPLLETLLLIAPLPRWRNPPSSPWFLDSPRPAHGYGSYAGVVDDHDTDGVDQNVSVIPTPLTLASFPGRNSSGASLLNALPVKNEPMSWLDEDSDMMHSHMLNGKRRKLI